LWVLRLYSIACRLFIIHKIIIFGSWVVIWFKAFKQYQDFHQVHQDFWQLKFQLGIGPGAARPGYPGFIGFIIHLIFKFFPINSYK